MLQNPVARRSQNKLGCFVDIIKPLMGLIHEVDMNFSPICQALLRELQSNLDIDLIQRFRKRFTHPPGEACGEARIIHGANAGSYGIPDTIIRSNFFPSGERLFPAARYGEWVIADDFILREARAARD
jgi:hypothetical protein